MSAEQNAERGKFYRFQPPQDCAEIIMDVFGREKVIQTQFTQEELEFIQRAREAVGHPDFLQSAAETSTVRSLTTYARIPWGGMLSNRRRALSSIRESYETAEQLAQLTYGSKIAIPEVLDTIKRNLAPFMPPLRTGSARRS